MSMRSRRAGPAGPPLPDPSVWSVYLNDHQVLGEVRAEDCTAAKAAAAAEWPAYQVLHVKWKRGVEKFLRKQQARIDRDLARLCYHEAGHAVLGLMLPTRRRLARVVVRAEFRAASNYDSLGRVDWYQDPVVPHADEGSAEAIDPDHERRVVEARIVTDMAGSAAEATHLGLARMLPLSGSDRRSVESLAQHCYGGDPRWRRHLAPLRARAKEEVRLRWPAVDLVARALIRHRELSGRKAEALVADALGGVPVPG
jgi:hypothetical protein